MNDDTVYGLAVVVSIAAILLTALVSRYTSNFLGLHYCITICAIPRTTTSMSPAAVLFHGLPYTTGSKIIEMLGSVAGKACEGGDVHAGICKES